MAAEGYFEWIWNGWWWGLGSYFLFIVVFFPIVLILHFTGIWPWWEEHVVDRLDSKMSLWWKDLPWIERRNERRSEKFMQQLKEEREYRERHPTPL